MRSPHIFLNLIKKPRAITITQASRQPESYSLVTTTVSLPYNNGRVWNGKLVLFLDGLESN